MGRPCQALRSTQKRSAYTCHTGRPPPGPVLAGARPSLLEALSRRIGRCRLPRQHAQGRAQHAVEHPRLIARRRVDEQLRHGRHVLKQEEGGEEAWHHAVSCLEAALSIELSPLSPAWLIRSRFEAAAAGPPDPERGRDIAWANVGRLRGVCGR